MISVMAIILRYICWGTLDPPQPTPPPAGPTGAPVMRALGGEVWKMGLTPPPPPLLTFFRPPMVAIVSPCPHCCRYGYQELGRCEG